MAKILKNHQFKRGVRGMYPWAEWLDGQTRELTQGTDFQCKATTLRLQAHTAAKEVGKRVLTTLGKDNKSLILQAIVPEDTSVDKPAAVASSAKPAKPKKAAKKKKVAV